MAFEISSGLVAKPQKVVVYGSEGIGKTSLAACFPSPLFIDTEGGSGHVDVRRMPSPTSWAMLVDEVTWVRDYPFECGGTLVLDTADWAERLCIAHVCAEKEWKGIEDAGYGKGYTYVKEEFGRLLNLLSECCERGLNVCVTAHAQIVKFEQPDEMGAYDRWELKLLRKQTAPMLKEWADALLFANYKTIVVETKDGKMKAQGGKNRVLFTTHSASWDAKNRWGLPDEVPMSWQSIAPYIPVPSFGQRPVAAAETPAQTAQTPSGPVPAASGTQGAEDPYAGRPARLRPVFDLLERSGVPEVTLRTALARKGYITLDTPLDVMDDAFVAWVVSAWGPIKEYIDAGMPAESEG